MTTITKAQAAKAFGAALFTHTRRQNSFVNMLTGAAPQSAGKDKNRGKNQTEKGAPIVMINDLASVAGDTVEMDLFHNLNGLPTMGDRKIAGRGESLSKTSFELNIDQGRKMVDSGGKMSQKRTKHNLLSTSKTLLGSYFNDLQDETVMYHLAGARGSFVGDGIITPLDDHSEFSEMMVNPILTPTYDRHLFGGDATSLESLDAADIMSLDKLDDMALILEEQANPIKHISFEADQMANESPFYLLFVSPRQWRDLWASATEKKLLELQSRAIKRGQGFNHPVFKGDVIMWRNILVRQYRKPVRFYAGDTVSVSNNDKLATTQQVTASVDIDRAILLGGQSLANAYGGSSSGSHFSMTTEKTDHGNGRETVIVWMNGCKKVRFAEKSGRVNDYGTMILDTAVTL
ncbi:N4-gp56 family major capsid protein [Shewanella sp. D64]|uniref:N4-gp56 family major capsid protein n=1 Tax=unclassified Shewanella TaxID=196818 RepID=UPI0022BA183B|nr:MULTISPECIES: N4-gp56 family major capsid protein [unclassified Shewanella]MEC4724263.1 N4-gp56 family major capsid protein [Shewanella sp. D64]MEC4738775.1 N4-gp56 family major capsid protein [Shewanella sp. E94]WBJ97785.1 N4-gp56 family major capsid protein [Shewanella sp. MTB7]